MNCEGDCITIADQLYPDLQANLNVYVSVDVVNGQPGRGRHYEKRLNSYRPEGSPKIIRHRQSIVLILQGPTLIVSACHNFRASRSRPF